MVNKLQKYGNVERPQIRQLRAKTFKNALFFPVIVKKIVTDNSTVEITVWGNLRRILVLNSFVLSGHYLTHY